jgi:hypothetical protein
MLLPAKLMDQKEEKLKEMWKVLISKMEILPGLSTSLWKVPTHASNFLGRL